MREDVPDVKLASVEMNRSNQPILVAADVEHDPVIDFVRRRKGGAQISKTLEVSAPYRLEPPCQRCFAVRVLLPE